MGDFNRSIWSLSLCNFFIYHTEIGICRKTQADCNKKRNRKTPNVRVIALLSLRKSMQGIFEKARHGPNAIKKCLLGARLNRK